MVFGVSLSKPHINRFSGAGCYGGSYNHTSVCHMSILVFGVPGTKFICTCPHHVHCVALDKNVYHSQTFHISNKMTAAVQPCPPSIIYTAKLGIRVTTVVRFIMCCSFRIHFKGADGSNWVQTALVRRHTGHWVLCLGKDTLQRGWLRQGNTVQTTLSCRRSGHRVSGIMLLK